MFKIQSGNEEGEDEFRDIVFYDRSVEGLKSLIEGKMEEVEYFWCIGKVLLFKISTKDVLEDVQERWPDLKVGEKKSDEKNFAYLLIKKLVRTCHGSKIGFLVYVR